MEGVLIIGLQILLAIPVLLCATIAFDVIHVLLHVFYNSNNKFLKKIGSLHEVHHQFLDTELKINEDKIRANVFCHVVPEYITQIAVTSCFFVIFPIVTVSAALFLETVVFLLIMKPRPGFDLNHRYVNQLKAYHPRVFCMPEYHLLHHVYPDAYFGSWLKTIDHIFKKGISLKGRKILVIGAETQFGKTFTSLLRNEGCIVKPINSSKVIENSEIEKLLYEAGILVFCHHMDNENLYLQLAKKFCEIHRSRHTPVELWALTSINELNPEGIYEGDLACYRKFVPYARKLFTSDEVIYRHIVVEGVNTPSILAPKILSRIKRGFNYVPGKLSASMIAHYLRFFFLKPAG